MNEEITLVGMDLGSYKTSIACSNGRRDMIPTALGWPKDHVAQAKIGSNIVFGKEIRRRRLILDIVRPFEHGFLKYNPVEQEGDDSEDLARRREAARLIVTHAVSLVAPDPDTPIYGVVGTPSRASLANKQTIMHAARAAFDAVAVIPEPFAIACSMSEIDEALIVDIGAGTIDICPILGRYPCEDEQVTIGQGGDSIDERLQELLIDLGAVLPREMVRDIKEKYGFAGQAPEPVVVELFTEDEPQNFNLTETLPAACEIIIKPIVDGIRTVLSKVDPEFRGLLRRNILLGGGGSQLRGLDRELERSLEPSGGNVRKVYDSAFAGAVGALKIAQLMPVEKWEHLKSLGELEAAA
ncbi:MAG: rod shape-determining protein [Planctomycetes bacterium]|nr:rod shape-determining protein [Planctomycetota bacterium]